MTHPKSLPAAGMAACALALVVFSPSLADPPPERVVQEGLALAAALGCGACHAGMPGPEAIRAAAPPLDERNPSLAADFVFAYLADPVRRRTEIAPARMPDFGLDEGERVALTLFLTGAPPAASETARASARHPSLDAAAGARMYAALGCGNCHEGPDAPTPAAGPDLSREGARVRPDWLERYLADPVPIRPRGTPPGRGNRMPDFRLTAAEAGSLAGWLGTLGRDAAAEPEARPLTAWEARKTEELVRDRLSCLGCHAIGGEGGEIGPALDGIGERLRPGFVRAMVTDPRRAVPGTVMPRPPLADDDRERVVAWLLGRDGRWGGTPERSLAQHLPLEVPEQDAAEGPALYGRYCAMCHGPEGGGDGWNAAALDARPTAHRDSAAMARRPDDTLFDGIHGGGYVLDRSRRMPAFGGTLSAEQIRALVEHIRELCDCEGPAWSRDGGA